jgi:flagellar biosynthetic protein FlhB
MPEDVGGEKVFPPTPRKKERAREEGNVTRSQELTSAIGLTAAMVALWFIAPLTFQYFLYVIRHYFEEPWQPIYDASELQSLMLEIGIYI